MYAERLVYIILAYSPISNLLHYYFPLTVFGFSFWNTFVVLLAIHLLLIISKPKKYEILAVILFTAIYLLISIFRNLTIETSFTHTFGNFWYLYLFLIFLVCVKKLKLSSKIISNICLVLTLFYGVIGTLYFFDLPTIEIQSEFNKEMLIGFKHRYEGILGASNIHSVYLITFYLIYSGLEKNKIIHWFLSPLVILSIIVSGSRLALIIFLLYWGYNLFNKSRFLFICIATILSFLTFYVINDFDFGIRLFDQGISDDSRIEKTIFFIELLKSNFLQVFVFGIEPSLLTNNVTNISDNSFSLIILNSGFIIFILWIIFIKFIQPIFFKSFFSDKIFLISIFLIFLLNNALLYLSWVLYVIIYSHFLSTKNIIYED